MVSEYPIIFSGQMVRAILEGHKTQTRQIIKPQPAWVAEPSVPFRTDDANPSGIIRCPFGTIGQRLWVRETCKAEELPCGLDGVRYADGEFREIENTRESSERWCMLNDYSGGTGKNVPSIHMPRWASRITLEITGVRVERLNAITQPDIAKEGIDCHPTSNKRSQEEYKDKFRSLWESINGEGSWVANPWVWVITFARINDVE